MKFRLPKTRVLEDIADEVVSYLDKENYGDGCSFFVKDEGSTGRFRLIATTNLSRFINMETIDAYDKKALSQLNYNEMPEKLDDKRLKGFGLTKYAIRRAHWDGKGYLSKNIQEDQIWSAMELPPDERDSRCDEMYCEVKASQLLSFMCVPLLTKQKNKENLVPFGLMRIVRAQKSKNGKSKNNFTDNDFDRFTKQVNEISSFLETAISMSSLATIGSAAIETERFWNEVIEKLSSMVEGTGSSVFECEEKNGKIRLVLKCTNGLYNEKGDKIDLKKIDKNDIYYEEDFNSKADALTTWVAKNKGNVIITNTNDQKEFDQYINLNRQKGRGKFSEHLSGISVIMVPVMSIDRSKVEAVIRITKEGSQDKKGKQGFSQQQVKQILAITPAISEIFRTARRLELLDSLSDVSLKNIKKLYKKVVNTVPKLIGAPGCTLLIVRNKFLYGEASSDPHIQKLIENGEFKHYEIGQGYTGYVAKEKKYLLINDREKDFDSGAVWSGRGNECDVGKKFKTCDRYLAVPIFNYSRDKVIGVIRTAKMNFHDEFTDIDRILLESFANRLTSAIETLEKEEKERIEHVEKIKNTFSPFLIEECKRLEYVSYGKDIKEIINQLENSSSFGIDIRKLSFRKLENLWKKTVPIPFEICSNLFNFENNILGDLPGYRDHFLHQFQVFLIGTYIIDMLKKIKPNIKALKKENLEKGWFLTANYHDMASTISLIEKWLPNFVSHLLNTSKSIVFSSRFVDLLIDREKKYYMFLDNMAEFLEEMGLPGKSFIEEAIIRLGVADHGILSALSLLKKTMNFKEKYIVESAASIALHTMLLEDDNKKLKKFYAGKMEFGNMPMAFLLLYCDNLHEWGRELGMVSSDKHDLENNLKKFKITITRKIPKSLNKNTELIKKIKKKEIIFIHSEIFVGSDFQRKGERLKQVFEILNSKNPLFSVELDNKLLLDSHTHIPIPI